MQAVWEPYWKAFLMSNKALWKRVCVTDPAAVKPITGKQYSGNSPKPYWIVERLTDEFGPCGIGWGFIVLDERMERLTETEILHVARVRFWYELDGKRGEFEQIGQTRALYAKRDKSLMVDEDAPKKSVTDALVKCASYLGFAGDIFSGMWDDSKYVNEAGKHWEAIRADESKTPRERELDDLAAELIAFHEEGKDMAAINAWYADTTFADNEERLYVWGLLREYSALRRVIKANAPQKEAA